MNGAHGFRSRNHPLIVEFFVLSQRDRPSFETMGEDWVEEAFSPCLFSAISRSSNGL